MTPHPALISIYTARMRRGASLLSSLPKRKAEFIEPMECALVSKLPQGPEWTSKLSSTVIAQLESRPAVMRSCILGIARTSTNNPRISLRRFLPEVYRCCARLVAAPPAFVERRKRCQPSRFQITSPKYWARWTRSKCSQGISELRSRTNCTQSWKRSSEEL